MKGTALPSAHPRLCSRGNDVCYTKSQPQLRPSAPLPGGPSVSSAIRNYVKIFWCESVML